MDVLSGVFTITDLSFSILALSYETVFNSELCLVVDKKHMSVVLEKIVFGSLSSRILYTLFIRNFD
jgi:hypothetical protein